MYSKAKSFIWNENVKLSKYSLVSPRNNLFSLFKPWKKKKNAKQPPNWDIFEKSKMLIKKNFVQEWLYLWRKEERKKMNPSQQYRRAGREEKKFFDVNQSIRELTLIKSTLLNLLIYTISMFKISKAVASRLGIVQRNLLLGGGSCKIDHT